MAWLALVDGTIAANGQIVALNMQMQSTAMIEVTGTWVGTLQFEYTSDNTNWYPLPVVTIDTDVAATSESVNGIWRADVSAIYTLRVRASAWTSGTAAVHITASDESGKVGSGGTVTITDGANVTQGTTTDAAYVSGAGTVVAVLKGIFTKVAATLNVNTSAALATAATAPPAATTAATDTSVTYPSQQRHIFMQNKTAANLYFAFDAVASLGTFCLYPQQVIDKDAQFTVLHLYTAAAQNINGTADLNIVTEARS